MCVPLQDYTNADNPFGDHHLLDKFVWHKVVYMYICMLHFSCYNGIQLYTHAHTFICCTPELNDVDNILLSDMIINLQGFKTDSIGIMPCTSFTLEQMNRAG